MRLAIIFSLALLLTSCAGRPDANVLLSSNLQKDAQTQGTKTVSTFVVSTRESDDANIGFTAARAKVPNIQKFAISIPPNHQAGKIEWPNNKPDPQKHFVVTERASLSPAGLKLSLEKNARAGKPISVFVHGFNYSYQEALFRAAQMAADANIGNDPIVFSWPSQGSVTGYVADKESATFSRDALVELLDNLASVKSPEKVIVFGHSMGGWLVMEAARQLKLQGKTSTLNKLRIVLAAPDIDADVFDRQIKVIGRMNPPITVLVSKDDRALQVSSFIGADVTRVGALDVENPMVREAAIDEGVQFIDISGLEASDPLNHDRYAALAKLVPQLDQQRQDAGSDLGQAGAFVFDAIGATISSPFRLASQVVNPR